jgi:hypothetical protein
MAAWIAEIRGNLERHGRSVNSLDDLRVRTYALGEIQKNREKPREAAEILK